MIAPLIGLMLLLQGTTGSLHLKDTVRDFPRSMLQPKVSGPISVDLSPSARASYQELAELAGLNILFDPDFRDGALAPAHLDNTDVFEALDRVSAAARSFVEVLDSKTLLVAPDNPTKRRDYELQVIKTIYLTTASSPQDLTAAITKLRTLNFRYLMAYAEAKAIVVRETPDRIAVAEKLLAESDKTVSSDPIAFDLAGNLLIPDGSGMKKSSPRRSRLQSASTGSTAIDMNEDARTTYQALAAMAGLNVLFDPDFRNPAGTVPLKFEGINILDALDLLGFRTRTFWEPVGSKTILISPDNQTKRRDYEQLLVRTIYFADTVTQRQVTEIITALRTLLNMRYLAQVTGAHAIAMMETPARIALAEKIIADLGMGGAPQGSAVNGIALEVGNETGGLLRSRAARNLAPAASQLNLKGTGTISVDMNEPVRETFERIAGMAGLHVTFDERFKDGPAQPFSVNGVSVLDALDFMSLQSKTFWEVLDSTTILVAPESQAVRRDLEPKTEKVIPLHNTATEAGAREIATALRTLLNLRQVETTDKAIVIADSLDRVALAEEIVGDLDR